MWLGKWNLLTIGLREHGIFNYWVKIMLRLHIINQEEIIASYKLGKAHTQLRSKNPPLNKSWIFKLYTALVSHWGVLAKKEKKDNLLLKVLIPYCFTRF